MLEDYLMKNRMRKMTPYKVRDANGETLLFKRERERKRGGERVEN